ncbi:hypothetical protein [Phenylobacterium sp.]|uniref:hypothetical protein n=1 Tax=Phenylobacterium sp. TaxID=1871053 RepID=UPI0035B35944
MGLRDPSSDLHAQATFSRKGRRIRWALKPGGAMFASFKRGETEREKGGRLFTDMTEEGLSALFDGAGLQVVDLWTSGDARAGREGEMWVGAVGATATAGR